MLRFARSCCTAKEKLLLRLGHRQLHVRTGWHRRSAGPRRRPAGQLRSARGLRLVPGAAPVIAAMHENCFGGGLQIALGADFGRHCQAEEVAAAARGSVGWPRTPRAGRAGRNVDSLLAGRVGATKRAIARWIFYAQMMDDSATFDSDNLVDFLKLTAATVDRAGDQLSGIRPTSSPPRAWRARARRRARISARRRRPANGRPARCRCPPGHARRSDRPRAR